MNRTHLYLTVNTNTWWKAELHLTNLESCTVCLPIEFHRLKNRIVPLLNILGPSNVSLKMKRNLSQVCAWCHLWAFIYDRATIKNAIATNYASWYDLRGVYWIKVIANSSIHKRIYHGQLVFSAWHFLFLTPALAILHFQQCEFCDYQPWTVIKY